jgi:hypothetical protein
MTIRIGSAAGAGPDRHPRGGWGRNESGPTAVMGRPAAGRTHGLWKIPREDSRLRPERWLRVARPKGNDSAAINPTMRSTMVRTVGSGASYDGSGGR